MLAELLKVKQWYKNLLVFLAPFFAGLLLDPYNWFPLVIGFLSLCAVSSAGYIINDVVDAPEDRLNPEKKDRPIASGRVSRRMALLISGGLALLGIGSALLINLAFGLLAVGLLTLTVLYSLVLKKIIVADVNLIATNFLLRAVSGALILNIEISHWLILFAYFFALYLALAKREGEIGMDKRRVLRGYSPSFLRHSKTALLSVLFILYIFYIFSKYTLVHFLTLPFFAYVVMKMDLRMEKDPRLARRAYRIFLEPDIIAASAIVLILLTGEIYTIM